MSGLIITQANGQATTIGKMYSQKTVYGNTYTDDFSMWSGRVYLCGLTMHANDKRSVGRLNSLFQAGIIISLAYMLKSIPSSSSSDDA